MAGQNEYRDTAVFSAGLNKNNGNVLSPGSMKSEGSAAIPWTQHDWHERVEPEVCGPSAVYLALQTAETFTGQVNLRAEFGKTWP